MLISERLKNLRREKGLTQKALADKIGIHVLTVQQYELGKRSPQADIIIKLAEALDVSTDFLLTGKTNDATPPEQRTLSGDEKEISNEPNSNHIVVMGFGGTNKYIDLTEDELEQVEILLQILKEKRKRKEEK